MHTARQHASLLRRHPAATYFLCAFAVSWLGAFALVASKLVQHQAIPKFTGLMLLGPSLMGLLLPAKNGLTFLNVPTSPPPE